VAAPRVERIVALGASNLTRGLPALVSSSRSAWGPGVEILAALGLGRSYGASSRILLRTLPGILQSALWSRLDALPGAATRALITDVGNDILYGSSPAEILAWVDECADRLQRHTRDVVVTDLPLDSIRRLSPPKFLAFRTFLFPRCRLSYREVLARAEEVTRGLEALAARRQLRLVRLRPQWYGFDPIHIRAGLWRAAWQEILVGEADGRPAHAAAWREMVRLYSLRPERRWILGFEQVTPQAGVALASGGRVWLY
jgi:hypothetical protein